MANSYIRHDAVEILIIVVYNVPIVHVYTCISYARLYCMSCAKYRFLLHLLQAYSINNEGRSRMRTYFRKTYSTIYY